VDFCEAKRRMWVKTLADARCFDLLHKPDPNVPSYAYGSGLFVFWPFLTSASVPKKFFATLKRQLAKQAAVFILYLDYCALP
jgi:hypothetical protein